MTREPTKRRSQCQRLYACERAIDHNSHGVVGFLTYMQMFLIDQSLPSCLSSKTRLRKPPLWNQVTQVLQCAPSGPHDEP
ncbi:hypothetical protein P171DRAFT_244198 [Karstenula rhodostoma CBS 690.94]|uniref:Uncharacterized protein n=1 Tax=Karstenula rhodostoma CBS 690.94 TaxID=1392251 RepID=A0A9P4PN13_9PLEO|nr:hypothetical protein P171DRAFT_244198 [Karstenula rhodostoma CBS 690.94]